MTKVFIRSIRPLLIVFIVLSGFVLGGKAWLLRHGFNTDVLLLGNLLIFSATIAAMWVIVKGSNSPNHQAAVRGMYGSFLIRFFLIAIVAFVYIMTAKKDVNKPALIACAALYFVYSFLEISALFKLLKTKKNA